MAVQGLHPCFNILKQKRDSFYSIVHSKFQPDFPLPDWGHVPIYEPITVASVGCAALIGWIWVTCPLPEPCESRVEEGMERELQKRERDERRLCASFPDQHISFLPIILCLSTFPVSLIVHIAI